MVVGSSTDFKNHRGAKNTEKIHRNVMIVEGGVPSFADTGRVVRDMGFIVRILVVSLRSARRREILCVPRVSVVNLFHLLTKTTINFPTSHHTTTNSINSEPVKRHMGHMKRSCRQAPAQVFVVLRVTHEFV